MVHPYSRVNGQVEKVEFSFVILFNSLQHQGEVIFVWNILHHQSCSRIDLNLINLLIELPNPHVTLLRSTSN